MFLLFLRVLTKFPWSGGDDSPKIACVEWDKIGEPNSCGGLEIKGFLKKIYLSLLIKCRWLILVDSNGFFFYFHFYPKNTVI